MIKVGIIGGAGTDTSVAESSRSGNRIHQQLE